MVLLGGFYMIRVPKFVLQFIPGGFGDPFKHCHSIEAKRILIYTKNEVLDAKMCVYILLIFSCCVITFFCIYFNLSSPLNVTLVF